MLKGGSLVIWSIVFFRIAKVYFGLELTKV